MKYWVHKVEQLWKEVETLKRKVAALENQPSPAVSPVTPRTGTPPVNLNLPVPTVRGAVAAPANKGQEDPVISLLRHHSNMNIVDLNTGLRELGIEESVRDTLFKRMKAFMAEGVVEFDEKTQTFFLR